MAAWSAPGLRRRNLAAVLFIAAAFTALIPAFAVLARDVLAADVPFYLALVTSATALALAVSGLFLLWTLRARTTILLVATVLFGLNLAAAALASYTWFTTITCCGGYSGPCYWPLFFCGIELILNVVAAVLVAVGVDQLVRRTPGPPSFVPPP